MERGSFLLHLLQETVRPPLSLRKCLAEWDLISVDLRERARKRALQAATVEQEILTLLS
jgi:hypothetical protein